MKSLSFSLKLVLFLAIVKTALIEAAFALNFLTFSYHGLLKGDGALIIISSLIIEFFIMLVFYTILFVALSSLGYHSTKRREYFVLSLLFTFIELCTWNLPNIRIGDPTSVICLLSINIFIFFIALATVSDYVNSRN